MQNKFYLFIKNNLIALIAVIIPLIIFFGFQRENYKLSIDILNDLPVVTVDREYASELVITYKNEKINQLNIMDISIKNSGNKPILPDDIFEPLAVSYPGRIVSEPTIIEVDPIVLDPNIDFFEDTIIIKPLLLNPGDSFVIRTYIMDRNITNVEIKGRIRNLRDLSISKNDFDFDKLFNLVSLVISTIAAIIIIARFIRFNIKFPTDTYKQISATIEGKGIHVNKLLETLDIKEHSKKSNLLFFRIKIESLIKELLYKNNLRYPYKASIFKSAELLYKNSIISGNVIAAIKDIMPLINRELHQSETYLSETEYKKLEEICLYIISYLQIEDTESSCQHSQQNGKEFKYLAVFDYSTTDCSAEDIINYLKSLSIKAERRNLYRYAEDEVEQLELIITSKEKDEEKISNKISEGPNRMFVLSHFEFLEKHSTQ